MFQLRERGTNVRTEIIGSATTSQAVPVQIGNLRDPPVLPAVVGFLLICVLMMWRLRGAILLGIAVMPSCGA